MIVGRAFQRGGVALLALAIASCGVTLAADDGPVVVPPRDDVYTGELDAGDGASGVDGIAPGDAGGDGDADGAARCSDELGFVRVTPLTDFGVATSLRRTQDGKTGFLSSSALTGSDAGDEIYEGPYPKGLLLYANVVTSPADDSHPSPLADPLALFYEGPGTSAARTILFATRSQPGQRFGAGTPVPLPLTAGVSAREPYALASGAVVYFAADPGPLGARDVVRASRDVGGVWSTAVVGVVSTGLDEGAPVVTEDELVIFFSRAGLGGGAQSDVWTAHRATPSDPFGDVLPVENVNDATGNDRPTWISADRCTLIFASDRSGASSLYEASRR